MMVKNLNNSGCFFFRLAQQFLQAMETMQTLGFSAKDLDEVKGIFSDTNIYLLAVTMFVAAIHVSKKITKLILQ